MIGIVILIIMIAGFAGFVIYNYVKTDEEARGKQVILVKDKLITDTGKQINNKSDALDLLKENIELIENSKNKTLIFELAVIDIFENGTINPENGSIIIEKILYKITMPAVWKYETWKIENETVFVWRCSALASPEGGICEEYEWQQVFEYLIFIVTDKGKISSILFTLQSIPSVGPEKSIPL